LVWIAIQRMTFHSWLVFGGILASAVVMMTVQGLRGAQTPLERITSVTTSSSAATATSGSGSVDSRVRVYKVAISRIEADPFIGVGLDLISITKPYGVISWEYDVHNLVIGTWYKAGLFGVIGILVTLAAILRVGAAALRASLSEDEWRTAAGLISAVVAFIVFAMSEPVLFSRTGWIPAALLLAFRTVQERRRAEEPEPHRAPILVVPSESRAIPGATW
jgi:O-antigen ligase